MLYIYFTVLTLYPNYRQRALTKELIIPDRKVQLTFQDVHGEP